MSKWFRQLLKIAMLIIICIAIFAVGNLANYGHIYKNSKCVRIGDERSSFGDCLWLVSESSANAQEVINFVGLDEYRLLVEAQSEVSISKFSGPFGLSSFHVIFDEMDQVIALIPTYE